MTFCAGSARSAHSNAYFYGFLKAKRIVLYDTLIKGYSIHEKKDEVSSIIKISRINDFYFQEVVTDQPTEKTSTEENTLTQRQTATCESKDQANIDQSAAKKKVDKGCDSEEVLAVLCHEFGHWSLSHTLINMSISFVSLQERKSS